MLFETYAHTLRRRVAEDFDPVTDLSETRKTLSILIVDDDPVAVQLIHSALSEHGDVRFALNGRDAFRVAQERPPDLILLDGEMPDESGFALCQRFKSDETLREIPIIFVTAHDDLRFEAEALNLGAADFIGKPISAPRLQLRVKLHLQLKEQVDRLRALAETDPLTKLANRRTFNDVLTREWARAWRTKAPLSLILIDIDCFKAYNDTYGHPAGDACLQRIADFVRASARRATDLAVRYGGEEFVLVLPDTPLSGALTVAEKFRKAVDNAGMTHATSNVTSHVTISAGLCCSEEQAKALPATAAKLQGLTEHTLLSRADRALYLAKEQGRNRTHALQLVDDSE